MARGLGTEYRKLWMASALSNLSDGLIRAALPLLAVRLTSSPSLVATVTMAASLPWLVFALPVGVLIDRRDRKATLWRTNTIRAGLLGGLAAAVWTDVSALWMLYVAALALGMLETFSDLAAETVVPAVVSRQQLERGNAGIYAARLTMNEFAGPAAAGTLAGLLLALPFVAGAAGYAGSGAVLLALRGNYQPEPSDASLRGDLVDGLSQLLTSKALRSMAIASSVTNLGVGVASSVLVVYAVAPGPLGLSDAGYGLLLSAAGAGGLLGAAVADSVVRRLGRLATLRLGIPIMAFAIAVPALTTDVRVVGALTFLGGASAVVWGVTSRSIRQRITADEVLGRINAAFQFVGIGMFPLGAGAAALLVTAVGVRATIATAGAVTIVGLLAMIGLRDSDLQTAVGPPAT